jgi:hypothetical protein
MRPSGGTARPSSRVTYRRPSGGSRVSLASVPNELGVAAQMAFALPPSPSSGSATMSVEVLP